MFRILCTASLFGIAAIATPAIAANPGDLDSNHDGVISQAEAEYDGKLKVEFKSLDANGDGRLDSTEISGLSAAPMTTRNLPVGDAADRQPEGTGGPDGTPSTATPSASGSNGPANVPGTGSGPARGTSSAPATTSPGGGGAGSN